MLQECRGGPVKIPNLNESFATHSPALIQRLCKIYGFVRNVFLRIFFCLDNDNHKRLPLGRYVKRSSSDRHPSFVF